MFPSSRIVTSIASQPYMGGWIEVDMGKALSEGRARYILLLLGRKGVSTAHRGQGQYLDDGLSMLFIDR